MTHRGTTSGPRELCPLCHGHGMVHEGTSATQMIGWMLVILFTAAVAFAIGFGIGTIW